MFWKASPIGANEWGNSNSEYVLRTKCYTHISSVSTKQRGDVIAFPSTSGSGHVGIVSYGNQYISAGDKTVDEKAIPSGKPTTVWRYNYNKQGCCFVSLFDFCSNIVDFYSISRIGMYTDKLLYIESKNNRVLFFFRNG